MTRRGRVMLTVPDDLKNQARVKAILAGKNLSEVVRLFLRAWIEGRIELPKPDEDKPK